MILNTEIKEQFKNKEIHKVLDTVLANVNNFEFEKGKISGHSINVWRIQPIVDEGSFLYYERVEDRDADWDLLMSLVELDN
jgi:hypothetical protein